MAADSGTYTDATLATRRRLAEAMMKQGTDASPISSHWQGLARLTNSLMGGYGLHKLGQEEKEANEKATASLMNLPGLGGSVSPAPGSPAPMVTSPSPSQALPTGDARTPASIRTNNPGAMWPGPSATKFGSTGHENLRDGNKIAVFPDATSGAAAQFDLLGRKYAGKTVQDAIREWSGGNHVPSYVQRVSAATGLQPQTVITPELLRSPQGVALVKAMAGHEAGPASPLTGDQWGEAQRMAFMDPAAEGGLPVPPQGGPAARPMPPSAPVQVAQAPGGTMTDAAPDAAQIKALIANPRTRAVGLQMYQQWRQQQTKQDAPTDVMRNYRMDVAQRVQRGEKDIPTLGEWMTAQKRAGATNVTMNQGYEKEFDKKLAAQEAERYDKLIKAGTSSRETIASLDMIGDALSVYNSGAKYGTGALGPAEQTLRSYAQAVGIGDAKTLGAAELAASVQNRMALQMRNPDGGMGMPGALSDADRKFLVASQPGIDKSPAGNAKMIENYKKLAQRQVQVGEMVADWVAKNGSMRGFEQHLNAWANANPLFPPADTSAGGWSIKRVQ